MIDPENKSEEELECSTSKVTFIPVIQPDDGVIVNVKFPSIYDPLFSEDIDVDKVGKSCKYWNAEEDWFFVLPNRSVEIE